MGYRTPEFNLDCNIWLSDGMVKPADGPADIDNVPCQKYVASKSAWPVSPPWAAGFWLMYHPPVQLRFARAAPFTDPWTDWKVTCVEVPAGSGQYYRTMWNDVQHEGFVNEYALIVGVQCDQNLMAIPPAGSSVPIGIGPDPDGIVPPKSDPIDVIPPGFPPLPPPSALPYYDFFSDIPNTALSSHTSDSGHTYTSATTALVIDSGGAYALLNATNSGAVAFVDYSGPSDGTVKGVFRTPAATAFPPGFGMLYRVKTTLDWLGAVVLPTGVGANSALFLLKSVAGTVSTVGSPSSSFVTGLGTDYLIQVVIEGAGITATVESGGVLGTLTATDTDFLDAPAPGYWLFRDTGHATCQIIQGSKG